MLQILISPIGLILKLRRITQQRVNKTVDIQIIMICCTYSPNIVEPKEKENKLPQI